MTFFSWVHKFFANKAPLELKDDWLIAQQNIAAEFEKRNLKKPISKKKPKAITPVKKSKPKKRKTGTGKRAKT